MKILVLNWRDIKNPAGGGAEILTHELAKGWVGAGNNVIWFTSRIKDSKKEETVDGVKIIREGAWWSVHIFAFFYYFKNHKDIDVIIDEVHWFPFFSAIYAREKTIALTCEVANKLFYTIFPYPIALVFRGIEKFYLYLYKGVTTITISESTKRDLIKEGIKKEFITVLNLGINIPKNFPKFKKEDNPTFIYLARLNKQKGIFDVIEAFSVISHQLASRRSGSSVISHPVLWIVGSGEKDVVDRVKEKVKDYDLGDLVKSFGFVTDSKKYELLARSHILLIPSAQEGWGLTAIEAACQGTPSVAYDVEGLRDSIVDKKTGYLTKNTPDALAIEALNLVSDKAHYSKISKEAVKWSKKFNWDDTRKKSLEVLNKFYKYNK